MRVPERDSGMSERGSGDQLFHFADGAFEADEYGAGNDGVSDVELVNAVESGDRANVVVVEAVSHVENQALRDGVESGFAEAFECGGAGGRSACFCPGSGVQLHGGDIQLCGFANLFDVGVDEQADEDPGSGQLCGALTDPLCVCDDVKSAFGGDFFATFGNECGLVREGLECDTGDFVRHGHFEIESEPDGFAKDAYVAILNVSAVLTQVNCDGVSATQFGQHCGLHRVWFGAASGLSNGGNVIDVYAEQGHDLGYSGRFLDVNFRVAGELTVVCMLD